MTRILLLDPNEDHAQALANALVAHHYSVTTCQSVQAALHHLAKSEAAFDVVIVVVISNRAKDWDALVRICRFVVIGWLKPKILCVARIYQGARMKLEAERMGARLVYERSI